MHLRIVETIFHRAPAVVKHLGPLSRVVYAHPGVKADSPSRRLGGSGRTCRAGHASCARCRGRRGHSYGVNTVAFAEEQRSAISRNVELRNATSKTTTTAACASLRWRLTG